MRMPKPLLLAGVLVLAGCQVPRGDVTVPTLGPRLLLANAPAEALLLIDSKLVGEAQRFNGNPEVLQLEPGIHLVEVRLGDRLLLSQKMFSGSTELRTVTF
jgi:hypothetical protein